MEFQSPDEIITHSQQKGVFPFAGREFVVIGSVKRSSDGTQAQLVSTSIQHDKIQWDASRVRATLHLAGWQLVKASGGTEVSYIVRVDIGGTVPSGDFHISKCTHTQHC